ncbi:MAG: hypothetical protein KBT04_04105 [Bacteroidales bacterium]|nr:hypothetical protein [Candidatus Colimorpha onthohippi]
MTPEKKDIIIIDEQQLSVEGQTSGDKPIIVVEIDDGDTPKPKNKSFWKWVILALVALVVVVGIVKVVHYFSLERLDVSISTSPKENIMKLQRANVPYSIARDHQSSQPEITITSDSILGVAMDLYELHGLQARISMTEPDVCDSDVYFYCRCSDYHPDYSIIGDLVVDGNEIPSVEGYRYGYFAGANGKYVIGISQSNDVKDYVKTCGGCFFRQFVLVSDYMLPHEFYLHGKVERRALGRYVIGNSEKIMFIETRHKETMWDFADALREYGFIDAIYITGGHDYGYYRSADGELHFMHSTTELTHATGDKVPWLLFVKE